MIKVAIIGSGAISDSHIQGFLKFKDRAQVVALADIYKEKAEAKIQTHGLDATAYEDYRQMLQKEDIDLVAVCTPPFGHAEASIDALNAGKHVLVEKPMATSLKECDEMIAAAQTNERLLSVVAQNRFKSPMMKLKQVMESGLLGKIVHGEVNSFWWRGLNYYNLWWRGTWEKEGGGCTMNHAVHHIDLFHWMMGMPDSLIAVVANAAHNNSEVEDFATAVLMYENGSLGQITASLLHHGEEQDLAFQGERAMVSVPWKVNSSRQRENGFPEDDPDTKTRIEAFYASLPDVVHEGHDGQIYNVLNTIEGKEPLLIDGAEGRKTIELAMAIYQSGALGRRVNLPLGPEDPFYTREGVLEHAPHFYEKTQSVENFADNTITLGSDYKEKSS